MSHAPHWQTQRRHDRSGHRYSYIHLLHKARIALLELLVSQHVRAVIAVARVALVVVIPVGAATALDAAPEVVVKVAAVAIAWSLVPIPREAEAANADDQEHQANDGPPDNHRYGVIVSHLGWRRIAAWRRGIQRWRGRVLAPFPVVTAS